VQASDGFSSSRFFPDQIMKRNLDLKKPNGIWFWSFLIGKKMAPASGLGKKKKGNAPKAPERKEY